ncbi:MAG: isoprenylcysteine carboxylmethyltransferase family protein [Chloroflexi bacterium]|nr:MAG: isoprenylcysteine carboxylmethyltransferase family protein [Chloroflexota bacterium]MBL1194495.1 isoprenylcysteine carboxylmethyltransferase family protein [Chloroflexota bacterium]NOH11783.1 isoprenylcysteine carboxylmethyltransferase family protein [Chloroflexota bacterium]
MNTTQQATTVDKDLILRKGLRNVLGIVLITGGSLFIPSGDLAWPQPWIILGLYALYYAFFIPWGLRNAPELLEERATSLQKEDQKSWDGLILRLYFLLLIGLYLVAGLDHRYSWTLLPDWALWLGFILIIPAYLLPLWALKNNPYASGVVRIQDDRSQQVATSGPYQYVRHPMYTATLFFGLGAPLFLDSWWALLPGILMAALFVLRTALEDRTLQTELAGYKEFTQQTRYRLIPGIW